MRSNHRASGSYQAQPRLLLWLVACLVLLLPLPTFAVSQVVVSSIGAGNFQIDGIGVEGASAFDISLVYDTQSMNNPRVGLGSLAAGSILETNPNTPGLLRIALIRVAPINGTGQLATVQFNLRGATAAKMISLNAKLLDSNAQPLRVATQILDSPKVASQTASVPSLDVLGNTNAVAVLGSNVAPTSSTLDPTEQLIEQTPLQSSEGVPPDNKVEQEQISTKSQPKEPRRIVHESVLERFARYKGKRNINAMRKLFDQRETNCEQTPSVVLSDGKKRVTVKIALIEQDKESISMEATDAQLLGMAEETGNPNTWEVQLLPTKGTSKSSIAYRQEDAMETCPLDVAPPADIDLDRSGSISTADANLYFSARSRRKYSEFDLNGDGKQDYWDDYLFVANYLVAAPAKETKTKTVEGKEHRTSQVH